MMIISKMANVIVSNESNKLFITIELFFDIDAREKMQIK